MEEMVIGGNRHRGTSVEILQDHQVPEARVTRPAWTDRAKLGSHSQMSTGAFEVEAVYRGRRWWERRARHGQAGEYEQSMRGQTSYSRRATVSGWRGLAG